MRWTWMILVLLVVAAFAGNAFAVGAGKTVEYAGGSAGKVLFNGKAHADKGSKCTDCHTKIFAMKKAPRLPWQTWMRERTAGMHNGTKAFKSSDPATCEKCHKK